MKEKKRVVPKKNYLYLILMLVMVVVVTFSIVNISKSYNNKKLEKSYLYKYVNEVTVDEVKNILTEPSSEMFILVTKCNDEVVYNFERDVKKVIKNHDLRDNFIYIDYTANENLDSLNKVLGSNIAKIPAIIYYKNGEVITNIDSSERMLNSGDFEQLLDSYEVD